MDKWLNVTVRHETDPHGRNEGVVIGRLRRFGNELLRVRWNSGVEEVIHPTELRPTTGLLFPGESPRQARNRINGFAKD